MSDPTHTVTPGLGQATTASSPTAADNAPAAAQVPDVEALLEALPWMQDFHGHTIVVKFGGNAMVDPALTDAFARDIAFLRLIGARPIVVHGGGPHISQMLDRLGITSEFRDGYRVTSRQAIEVVRMVLGGQVARELVAAIAEVAPVATGISGEDAGLFQARRKTTNSAGEPVDYGHVGEIVAVNPRLVTDQLAAGRIPVISTIASDVDHPREALNINADRAAAALAVAVRARKLVILTDVEGIYRNWPDPATLISSIHATELRELLPGLSAGMIPKVQACLEAVDAGVSRASIVDGRVAHSTLREMFTTVGFGTEVLP